MSADSERVSEEGAPGAVADILAIIESAKARGGVEGLERHIAKSLPDATDSEVTEAAEVALEIIESVPVFLLRARQEAEERQLSSLAGPLLDHAERYYLQPLDLIPEMTQGLSGLLDDSYLVIRILQSLDRGPTPFLDWDLDYPIRFMKRLVGPVIAERLDLIAAEAMHEASSNLAELWQEIAHHA